MLRDSTVLVTIQGEGSMDRVLASRVSWYFVWLGSDPIYLLCDLSKSVLEPQLLKQKNGDCNNIYHLEMQISSLRKHFLSLFFF